MPSKNVKKLLDNHLQNLYSELSSGSVTGQDRKDLVAELIALSKMQCTIEENDAKIKLDFEKEEHSYDLKKMESDRDFSNKNDELSIEKAKIEREIALKEDENKIRFSEEESSANEGSFFACSSLAFPFSSARSIHLAAKKIVMAVKRMARIFFPPAYR